MRSNGGSAVIDVESAVIIVIYDVSQEKAVPVMLMEDSRQERTIEVVDSMGNCSEVEKDEDALSLRRGESILWFEYKDEDEVDFELGSD